MSLSFIERLKCAIESTGSHLCVGLDPDMGKVRQCLEQSGEWSSVSDLEWANDPLAFCEKVAEVCAPYAAVYKPNAAFFEENSGVMERLSTSIRKSAPGALTICDAKRGDIGNTSEQYANCILETWKYDSVTVNPLMGHDAVRPFLSNPSRGAFLLCLTSNPGASDFLLEGNLFHKIAIKAQSWNQNGNVGLVVGATQAAHAGEIRQLAPGLPLLIPGVGAQGGDLKAILDAIDGKNNPLFVINVSRGILYPDMATPGAGYLETVAEKASYFRNLIKEYL